MPGVLDIHDLPEEDAVVVQKFVEFLRATRKSGANQEEQKENIVFSEWPLKIKGKLTRREIYDYL